jgi:hypothetical protein
MLPGLLDRSAEALEIYLQSDLEAAMNRFNQASQD